MEYINKIITLVLFSLIISGCSNAVNEDINKEDKSSGYGVFLGLQGNEAVLASEGYDLVIIDAQYLLKEEIATMQERGQKVYSYLNIGSLENFRPYYNEYKDLILEPYLNWEEEYWIDVESEKWQEFIKEDLIPQLLEKEIDGFFVDNVDVYSHFSSEKSYSAIQNILESLMSKEKAVLINGGDEFVYLYFDKNKQVDDILTGVNQETVFTSVNFEKNSFSTQRESENKYYLEYLNSMDKLNKDVYLLEYSTNMNIINIIREYTEERGWGYYTSSSLELNDEN